MLQYISIFRKIIPYIEMSNPILLILSFLWKWFWPFLTGRIIVTLHSKNIVFYVVLKSKRDNDAILSLALYSTPQNPPSLVSVYLLYHFLFFNWIFYFLKEFWVFFGIQNLTLTQSMSFNLGGIIYIEVQFSFRINDHLFLFFLLRKA